MYERRVRERWQALKVRACDLNPLTLCGRLQGQRQVSCHRMHELMIDSRTCMPSAPRCRASMLHVMRRCRVFVDTPALTLHPPGTRPWCLLDTDSGYAGAHH